MPKQSGGASKPYHKLHRIYRLEEDWCTPVAYLPLIYHVLGQIDLDPGSTEKANNEFLKADQIFTKQDDALNQEAPWRGNVYCFPPTYGRCSYNKQRGTWRWSTRGGYRSVIPSTAWFKRLEKDWKLGYVNSALFFSIAPEMMRTQPNMWDYPVCIPYRRPQVIHGRNFYELKLPLKWGFIVYLPPRQLGFDQAHKFQEAFSTIGKVVL